MCLDSTVEAVVGEPGRELAGTRAESHRGLRFVNEVKERDLGAFVSET